MGRRKMRSVASPKLGRILIVDDEAELVAALREALEAHGYEARGFTCPGAALTALREEHFDLLLSDLSMPEMDGTEVLRATMEIDPHLISIVMTGESTVQKAVEAIKVGALHYILKPFQMATLLPILAGSMEVRRLRRENIQLRELLAIHQPAQAVPFTLDLNGILDEVAEAALKQCEADEVSVLLPTASGDELYVAAIRGEHRAHLLGQRVPMDWTVAGWVACRQEPVPER